MDRLNFIKNELRDIRDNDEMNCYSYNQIDLALDELYGAVIESKDEFNYFKYYLMDKIKEAKNNKKLPTDLSNYEILSLINIICNDSILLNFIDNRLSELFYYVRLDRKILSKNNIDNKNKIIKPFKFIKKIMLTVFIFLTRTYY